MYKVVIDECEQEEDVIVSRHVEGGCKRRSGPGIAAPMMSSLLSRPVLLTGPSGFWGVRCDRRVKANSSRVVVVIVKQAKPA